MDVEFHIGSLLNGLVFAIAGIVMLIVTSHVVMSVIGAVRGVDVWKEITEKQNVALAVVSGMLLLGVAIIIASALH